MSILQRFKRSGGKGNGDGAADGAPRFVGKEKRGDNTYETYRGEDAASARSFLETKKVTKPQYYVIVETPDGNWGVDKEGLFLENVRPWQKDVGKAECVGEPVGIPSIFGLQWAAQGINDNFVTRIECGKCQHVWPDALRYQNVTAVRCPECKALNKVDSERFTVYGV